VGCDGHFVLLSWFSGEGTHYPTAAHADSSDQRPHPLAGAAGAGANRSVDAGGDEQHDPPIANHSNALMVNPTMTNASQMTSSATIK
jgi:hypothetical protein